MTIDEVQDLLSYALQADLENGVAWLNDEVSKRFFENYPELSKAIGLIMEVDEDEISSSR